MKKKIRLQSYKVFATPYHLKGIFIKKSKLKIIYKSFVESVIFRNIAFVMEVLNYNKVLVYMLHIATETRTSNSPSLTLQFFSNCYKSMKFYVKVLFVFFYPVETFKLHFFIPVKNFRTL